MSLFQRIVNLVKKPEPPIAEKTPYTLAVGDIIEISLNSYTVSGRTLFPQRREAFFTLKDGREIRYFRVEKRETSELTLFTAIDGRLENSAEIPATIDMDGNVYHLESQAVEAAQSSGDTPFPSSEARYLWDFQSDDHQLLRIEWQAGQMMLYEGAHVLPLDVGIIGS
jgi:hypothetical protein